MFDNLSKPEKVYLLYSGLLGSSLFLGIAIVIFVSPFSKIFPPPTINTDIPVVRSEYLPTYDQDQSVKGSTVEKSVQKVEPITEKEEEIVEIPKYVPPTLTSCDEVSKINTTEKIIVFTFDADGRDNSIDEILKAFADRGLKTTFFVEGRWTRQFPQHVRSFDQAGHEIYNHSNTHPKFTTLTDEGVRKELDDANSTIEAITGKTTKPFFRPPYGDRDERVRNAACAGGYQSVVWNVDAWDWREYKGVTAQEVKDRVIGSIGPGNIVLMHTGNDLTGAVIGDLLDTVISLGYKPVTYSEALSYTTAQ